MMNTQDSDNVVYLNVKLSTGDLVALKSGGPIMTVRSCSPAKGKNSQSVIVDWFVGEENCTAVFLAEQLFIPKDEGGE